MLKFCVIILSLVFGFHGVVQAQTQNITSNATDSTPITFKVCNKTPEKVNYPELQTSQNHSSTRNHLAAQLKAYNTSKSIQILQGSNFSNKVRASENGFIYTVIDAYNGHHNLVIRPDDIWIAILSQFSLYVNANAEKFRGQFVNFTGKKELNVILNGSNIYDVSYDGFVKVMIDKIHENLIDDEIRSWVIPDFTTTKEDDIVTSGVILMATLKHYFKYKGTIICGIPSITLEGSVEDWTKIQNRLKKLDQYELSKWTKILDPIIEQFIQAKSGNVDDKFWEDIFFYESVNVLCGDVNYISGWITAFAVFNANGEWQGGEVGKLWPRIEPDQIPSSVVQIDVLIDDKGREYNTKMFAGHMGSEILENGYTLQPRSGWAIALLADNTTGKPTTKTRSINTSHLLTRTNKEG